MTPFPGGAFGRWRHALVLSAAITCHAAYAAGPTVFLDDMTWTDVRDALHAGKTTIIIPVGGTEQSGPQLALGKHNLRAHAIAGRIAEQLGNTLVAPVVNYVPEGNISPPTEHMRFAGTISIPDAAFKGVIDGAARSLRAHGFRDIVLVGEHGGYQSQLAAVAEKLNRDWAGSGARAHFIAEYYRSTQTAYVQVLRDHGLTETQIGTHAGAADTSLSMAVSPEAVRPDQFALAAREGRAIGVLGDPRPSSVALGQLGVDLIVSRSVAAIRAAVPPRP